MSAGLFKGVNSMGHIGWVRVKCRICARTLFIGRDIVYHCPKCVKTHDAYFCEADYKRLKGRCPFCGSELKLII